MNDHESGHEAKQDDVCGLQMALSAKMSLILTVTFEKEGLPLGDSNRLKLP